MTLSNGTRLFRKQCFNRIAAGGKPLALATLTKFNGIISWISWDKFGIYPEFIAAVSARKEIGLTVSKGKRGKDVVMQHMLDSEPWFEVEYGRTGKVKPHFYDMADSFVVAKAGYLRCTTQKS